MPLPRVQWASVADTGFARWLGRRVDSLLERWSPWHLREALAQKSRHVTNLLGTLGDQERFRRALMADYKTAIGPRFEAFVAPIMVEVWMRLRPELDSFKLEFRETAYAVLVPPYIAREFPQSQHGQDLLQQTIEDAYLALARAKFEEIKAHAQPHSGGASRLRSRPVVEITPDD